MIKNYICDESTFLFQILPFFSKALFHYLNLRLHPLCEIKIVIEQSYKLDTNLHNVNIDGVLDLSLKQHNTNIPHDLKHH